MWNQACYGSDKSGNYYSATGVTGGLGGLSVKVNNESYILCLTGKAPVPSRGYLRVFRDMKNSRPLDVVVQIM